MVLTLGDTCYILLRIVCHRCIENPGQCSLRNAQNKNKSKYGSHMCMIHHTTNCFKTNRTKMSAGELPHSPHQAQNSLLGIPVPPRNPVRAVQHGSVGSVGNCVRHIMAQQINSNHIDIFEAKGRFYPFQLSLLQLLLFWKHIYNQLSSHMGPVNVEYVEWLEWPVSFVITCFNLHISCCISLSTSSTALASTLLRLGGEGPGIET